MTDRTFAVFNTEVYRAGEVYDETFHTHARAIMEPLRRKLMDSGRQVSEVEDHSFYGVAFTVDDPASGRVRALLQVVDPWLLMLTRELKLLEKIGGADRRQVDDALVSAVDAALTDLGAFELKWYTAAGFDEAARKPGAVGQSSST